jgi:hypothetical protein
MGWPAFLKNASAQAYTCCGKGGNFPILFLNQKGLTLEICLAELA